MRLESIVTYCNLSFKKLNLLLHTSFSLLHSSLSALCTSNDKRFKRGYKQTTFVESPNIQIIIATSEEGMKVKQSAMNRTENLILKIYIDITSRRH